MTLLSELEDTLSGWTSRFGGREWMVTRYGVLSRDPASHEEEAHRTDGQPLTVTRYLYHWREECLRVSAEEGVPLAVLLATLATENGPARMVGGEPHVAPPRKEPGYTSDEATPHRISIGPCHVLISTARAAMEDEAIDRAWLTDLGNNMRASFRALRHKHERWGHDYDPILAASCYNSGGLYDASNPRSIYHNRWHLRTYGSHLDRFANWYGDACYLLADEPAVEPAEDPLAPLDPSDLSHPQARPPNSLPLPERLRRKVRALLRLPV